MPVVDNIAAALLTYAAHSFIACAAALVAARFMARPQYRDLVWKGALTTPIFTTAASLGVTARLKDTLAIDLSALLRELPLRSWPGREVIVIVTNTPAGRAVDRRVDDPVASLVAWLVVVVASALVVAALTRLVRRRTQLARMLASRETIETVTDEALGTSITISESHDLPSPVAFGRAEICLPSDVAASFGDHERCALIAHETAHLERRDPAWFLAIDVISALSAFQPLAFLTARAFRRDVELICDEAAVCRTRNRSALIAALARLAAPFDARAPLLGVASAYDGSPLANRAQRIATVVPHAGGAPKVRRAVLVGLAAAAALLCATPTIAPIVHRDEFSLDPDAAAAEARARGRVVSYEVDSRTETGTMSIRDRRIVHIR